jgi:NAD(P)-dependent dehydrogenase (short-subunit alcohol dehydrogenase family)
MEKVNQRVVLITGASSGIGRACAEHLHQRGYRVYGTSRRVATETPSTSPVGFKMIKVDVDVDSSVGRGIEWVVEREGRLDVVVNNAGFGLAGAIEDTSIEEAKAQLETNFFGTLRVCRAVLPIMRKQGGGYIINIGSLAGRISVPFQALYSASKFAIEGLTEALRLEVRPYGIRVVLIEPGDLATEFTAHRRRTAESQQNTAYRERCETALRIMEASEAEGSTPEVVARLLERIIEDPSPRLRYTVGPMFQRAMAELRKIMPARLFEWSLARYYRLD